MIESTGSWRGECNVDPKVQLEHAGGCTLLEALPAESRSTLHSKDVRDSRMRVLLTNHHLRDQGGSEMYTYTLYKNLASRGFEIEVFTLHPGAVSEKMEVVLGTSDLAERPAGYYDLALINHRSCLRLVRHYRVARRAICTLHGVFPWQEQPLPGADAYVSVSEEVQAHAAEMGFESTVIRNGVDTERFRPIRRLRQRLGRVVLLSNYAAAAAIVREACQLVGCEFDHVGKYSATTDYTWEVEERLNDADLVVSVGRGALEGLACGRNVVVYDNRLYQGYGSGDGFFTSALGTEMAKNNYSGRRFAIEFSPELLAQELDKYDPGLAEGNREYVLENHDIRSQADKYLELAENAPE